MRSLSGLDRYAASLRESGHWDAFERLTVNSYVKDMVKFDDEIEHDADIDSLEHNYDIDALKETFGDKLSYEKRFL